MNPGVTETVGDTAKSAIDALKSTPVILALVIFNALYMALGAWQNLKDTDTRSELLKTWSAEHMRTSELLSRCVVDPSYQPPRTDRGMRLQSDSEVERLFTDPPKPNPVAPPPK
jgi:hypothetical protein